MKQNEGGEETSAVARANNQYLYKEDLVGIVPQGMNPEDSAQRVEHYINSWARKQLLINEARNQIQFNEAEIERKVLDYRYSLLGYEFQQYYINSHLDKEISDAEIQQYYEENIDNFVLKQNIIRGKYVKIPKQAPKVNKLKQMIRSNDQHDFEELKSYCLSFATSYQLYDSVWMVFDDVIKDSPLAEVPNKVDYLRRNKTIETSDENHLYYYIIVEYRISDNISPLEFVRDQIRNIILNKRKVELAKKLEEDVYQKAIQENRYEIYN
ncbi:MAG: peptidylprolyl isomerase [Cyclobacteriaceae bacterium]|nr:peptidylprolyl isomerase [Cyclobacteriaceae bacterium]